MPGSAPAEPAGSAYLEHDGLGLAALVARGELHPRELLEAAIARVEAVNPHVNAVCLKLYEQARQEVERGLPEGPFRGVPFLVKDLGLKLQGTVTSAGSRFFQEARAELDSTLVARHRKAGLAIFGKTATPELGLTGTTESLLFGQTRNPWNLERTAGGSSGGSGAAVASGMVPMAHASDGAGSIRTPSSCCGVFGLKPTRGRVPLGPDRAEGWNGLSTVHAVTRSVRDSAALLDATAGPEAGDPYWAPPPERPFLEEVGAPPTRLRIALMKSPPSGSPVDPECLRAADAAAVLCAELGHEVEEAAPQVDFSAINAGLITTLTVATAQALEDRARELGRPVSEQDVELVTWRLYRMGLEADGLAYARARAAFDAAGRALARFHRRFDVILSPTLAKPPVKLGVLSLSPVDYDAYLQEVTSFGPFTALFNMTGEPSMSVPLHWTPEGLPVGVMFSGRFGGEATLFRLAAQLEQARPWFRRRPAL